MQHHDFSILSHDPSYMVFTDDSGLNILIVLHSRRNMPFFLELWGDDSFIFWSQCVIYEKL